VNNTNGGTNYYSCGYSGSAGQTCNTDFCNCPGGHKSIDGVRFYISQMRSIMYPVMGVIFALLWIAMAFLGRGRHIPIVLLVCGLIDAIFGIFLIFLPVTTYLGLFYALVGALAVAVGRHHHSGKDNGWGLGSKGLIFVIILTVLVFFITGGLTVFSYDQSRGTTYFEAVNGYISSCMADMNLYNNAGYVDGLRTRCENWALFTAFCVFFLFLVQPIAIMGLLFSRHHKKTEDVVVNVHQKTQTRYPEQNK
jgi:hypothetical protein